MAGRETAVGCGLLLGVTGLFVVLPTTCGVLNNYEYSKGTRVGVINKFSERGTFWKTWEGQLALEGIVSSGNNVGANVWDFSLDRQHRHGEDIKFIGEKIQKYLESGTKVKVTYTQPWVSWPWRSGTDYLVQSVDPIEPK